MKTSFCAFLLLIFSIC